LECNLDWASFLKRSNHAEFNINRRVSFSVPSTIVVRVDWTVGICAI